MLRTHKRRQSHGSVRFYSIAGSFRVSSVIDSGDPGDLEKRSGSFMIIRWPVSLFAYY